MTDAEQIWRTERDAIVSGGSLTWTERATATFTFEN